MGACPRFPDARLTGWRRSWSRSCWAKAARLEVVVDLAVVCDSEPVRDRKGRPAGAALFVYAEFRILFPLPPGRSDVRMSLITFMDSHEGTAAWVQAVGSILAIGSGFAALLFQNWLARRREDIDRNRFLAWVVTLSALLVQGIQEFLEQLRAIEARREAGESFPNTEFRAPFLEAARAQIAATSPTMFKNPLAAHSFLTLGATVERVIKEAELAGPTLSVGRSIEQYIVSINHAQEEAVACCARLGSHLG